MEHGIFASSMTVLLESATCSVSFSETSAESTVALDFKWWIYWTFSWNAMLCSHQHFAQPGIYPLATLFVIYSRVVSFSLFLFVLVFFFFLRKHPFLYVYLQILDMWVYTWICVWHLYVWIWLLTTSCCHQLYHKLQLVKSWDVNRVFLWTITTKYQLTFSCSGLYLYWKFTLVEPISKQQRTNYMHQKIWGQNRIRWEQHRVVLWRYVVLFVRKKRESLSLGPCGPLRNYFCLASNQLSIV